MRKRQWWQENKYRARLKGSNHVARIFCHDLPEYCLANKPHLLAGLCITSINRHFGEGLGVRAGPRVHDDVGARQGHHACDVRAQFRQAFSLTLLSFNYSTYLSSRRSLFQPVDIVDCLRCISIIHTLWQSTILLAADERTLWLRACKITSWGGLQ